MQRLIRSFGYAWEGIRHCFTHEPNFKIHVGFAAAAASMCILLQLTFTEWAVILICIAMVIAMEMVNTAVEHLCNLVYPSQSQVIKKIKDMAAGAVLICAMVAAICGLIIFIPKIIHLF